MSQGRLERSLACEDKHPARPQTDDQLLPADTRGHVISPLTADATRAQEVLAETSLEVAQEVEERCHSLDKKLCKVAQSPVATP